MLPDDTIAAISTPPGNGGIGIVRLAGPAAHPLALALLRRTAPLTPRRATFLPLPDPEAGASAPKTGAGPDAPKTEAGQGAAPPLDQVVVTLFAAPHSYTGEDIVEIAAHGSPVVLHTILRAALAQGARLANPGEFTHRAFLAGKLDLTAAEAVHDLISATTLHQARVAASQLHGSLAATVAPLKQHLITLIATLEAGIDFAEDDIDILPAAEIASAIARVATPLRRLESTFRYGNLLRGGLPLAIVGAPNTGKSSLFNALLGRDRAIVTPVPGTTRDLLSEPLSLHGIPVELTDTAGLRHTTEPVEAIGIARSRSALAEAAAILLVLDATHPLPSETFTLLLELEDRPLLLVANKLDLADASAPEIADRIRLQIRSASPVICGGTVPPVVAVSALTGEGLPDLRSTLHTLLAGDALALDTTPVTGLRQQGAITQAVAALAAASAALTQHTPHELLLLDLHTALDALDALTGTTTPDDILHRIFSSFCIGK